jgi:hypothetical protein
VGKALVLLIVVLILLAALLVLTNNEVKEKVFKAIPVIKNEGEEESEELSEAEGKAVSGEGNEAKAAPTA